LKEKKENAQNQFSAFCGEIREQETKKAQLEEKIKKLNTARSQIRRQLDELKATAEPEVANVELLVSKRNERNAGNCTIYFLGERVEGDS
jgi:predicted nuclease with TOPRIM domain